MLKLLIRFPCCFLLAQSNNQLLSEDTWENTCRFKHQDSFPQAFDFELINNSEHISFNELIYYIVDKKVIHKSISLLIVNIYSCVKYSEATFNITRVSEWISIRIALIIVSGFCLRLGAIRKKTKLCGSRWMRINEWNEIEGRTVRNARENECWRYRLPSAYYLSSFSSFQFLIVFPDMYRYA